MGTPLWAHAGVRWVHLCRPCRGEVGTPLGPCGGKVGTPSVGPCRGEVGTPSVGPCGGEVGTPLGPCGGKVGTPLWAHAGVRWVHLCGPMRG